MGFFSILLLPKFLCCVPVLFGHGGQIPSYDWHVVCLLQSVNVKHLLDHLLVRACGGASIQYGPSHDRAGGQGQVYAGFAFLAVSRPLVSGPVVICNLQPLLIHQLFLKGCIALLPASRVTPSAVCIHVSRYYCATHLSDVSVPVELL